MKITVVVRNVTLVFEQIKGGDHIHINLSEQADSTALPEVLDQTADDSSLEFESVPAQDRPEESLPSEESVSAEEEPSVPAPEEPESPEAVDLAETADSPAGTD